MRYEAANIRIIIKLKTLKSVLICRRFIQIAGAQQQFILKMTTCQMKIINLYYDITDEYKDVSPGIVKALKEVEIDDKVYSVNGKNFVLD